MTTTDDITELLLAGNTGEMPELGFHQGIVVAWDIQTGENIIRTAGTDVVDIQMLNSTEALVLEPGHVVGLLRFKNTYFILGRIVTANSADYFSGLLPTISYPTYQTNADEALQTTSVDSNYYPKLVAAFVVSHLRAHFSAVLQPSGGTPTGNFRVQWYTEHPGNGANPANGTLMYTSPVNSVGSGIIVTSSYEWPQSARGDLVYVSFEVRMITGAVGEWMAVITRFLYGAD